MTDDKALREKLDAMIAARKSKHDQFERQGYDWMDRHADVLDSIALDLLREKEERETPCVWTLDGVGAGWYLGCDPRKWEQSRGNFCSGCGHPVQVKQPQEDKP